MQLMDVSDEKDLGVIVSQDVKWEKQCSSVVRTANRVLGMIKRNFVDTSKDTILALTYIRVYYDHTWRTVVLYWLPITARILN